jgi:hypothetical protein
MSKSVRVRVVILEREHKERATVLAAFDNWQSAENFVAHMKEAFNVLSHRIEGPASVSPVDASRDFAQQLRQKAIACASESRFLDEVAAIIEP